MRLVLAAVLFFIFYQNATAQNVTEDQIKQLALEAILENPEIIMQAVAILQQREKERGHLAPTLCVCSLNLTPTPLILATPRAMSQWWNFLTTIAPTAEVRAKHCKLCSPRTQMFGSFIVNGRF